MLTAVLNPAQFRLLLAGPRVSRLHPFFTARRYICDAVASGEEALQAMRATPRHVLLVELELNDMLLADMLQTVRQENLAGAVILIEDPAKSGLIVSTLARGVDGYVATPPDENLLFRMVERQLLAQWALAQEMLGQQQDADKTRLEKQVQQERAKVLELVKEIAALREELAAFRRAHEGAPVRTSRPAEAVAPQTREAKESGAQRSQRSRGDDAAIAKPGKRSFDFDPPRTLPDAAPPRIKPLPPKHIPGFDEAPGTRVDDDDSPDLYLDLEERTSEVNLPKASAGVADDDRFLLDDD